MTEKKIALIPSCGIGDGIIFLRSANALAKQGHKVTIYHDILLQLAPLFPSITFFSFSSLDETLTSYDDIIVQNDHSRRTQDLIRKRNRLENMSLLYSSYKLSKHGPLKDADAVFDRSLPIEQNLCDFFTSRYAIIPDVFSLLNPQKNTKVCIHPISSDKEKNWPLSRYLSLYKKLKNKGFDPFFLTHIDDSFSISDYKHIAVNNLLEFTHVLAEASYLIANDSFSGHLSSLLDIPYLIIAKDYKHMQLWKPSSAKGKIITPYPWIINCKPLRLRQKLWKYWISVSRVYRTFLKINNL